MKIYLRKGGWFAEAYHELSGPWRTQGAAFATLLEDYDTARRKHCAVPSLVPMPMTVCELLEMTGLEAQPIETAPKDRLIWGWAPSMHHMMVCRFDPEVPLGRLTAYEQADIEAGETRVSVPTISAWIVHADPLQPVMPLKDALIAPKFWLPAEHGDLRDFLVG